MTARIRPLRLVVWALAGALVVLAARTLAYALAPQPTLLSLELERQAGGPHLVVVGAVAVAACAAVAAALLWLAVVAVRERHLAAQAAGPPPRIGLLPVLVRALALWAACSVAFATLESYLHWRAGLGFHGLHCLVGPVHRDALPILAALAVLAAAAVSALEHIVDWLRRAVAALSASVPPPSACPLPIQALLGRVLHAAALASARRARAPPALLGV